MSILRIEYDSFRGGFLLMVAGFDRQKGVGVANGVAGVYFGKTGQFAVLESWRRLPLRRIHLSEFEFSSSTDEINFETKEGRMLLRATRMHNEEVFADFKAAQPAGKFAVSGQSLRVKAFHLHQTPEKFSVWFSRGDDVPRANWIREDLDEHGVTLWFSPRTLPLTEREKELNLPARRPLAGVEVSFATSEASFPITEVYLEPMDFK